MSETAAAPVTPATEAAVQPFYFGIPLRSAQTAKNWQRVVDQLELTIDSALANGTDGVSILIGCHEIPELRARPGVRIEFLQTDRALPTTPTEQRWDRLHKHGMIVERVVAEGGGYLMILDCDDLLSSEIVDWVRKDDNRAGYVLRQGFLYYAQSGKIDVLDDFDQRCGSSTVRYLKASDADRSGFDWIDFFTREKFQTLYEKSQATDRPFGIIPFPAGVYIRENGENLSQQVSDSRAGPIKRLVRFFRRRAPKKPQVPTVLIEKFGLKPDAYR